MTSHAGVVSTLKTTLNAAVSTVDALLGVGVQSESLFTCGTVLLTRRVEFQAVRRWRNTALSSILWDFLGLTCTSLDDPIIVDGSTVRLEGSTCLTCVFILQPVERTLAF